MQLDALGNPIERSPLTHVTETGYVLRHRLDKVRSAQIVADSRTGLRETKRLAAMADLLSRGHHVDTVKGRIDATSRKDEIVDWFIAVAWADDISALIGVDTHPDIAPASDVLDFI